jgi:AcrR family transcriptional regulator
LADFDLRYLQASNCLHAQTANPSLTPMEIRNKILDAALHVFAETGYRGATTRRIAQIADVNEVTLFRHFGSKEELIRAAVQHAGVAEGPLRLPDTPADPYEELTRWAEEHYRRLQERGPLLRACLAESIEHREMAECACEGPVKIGADLRRYLGLLTYNGRQNPDDTEVAAAMLMSLLFTDAVMRDVMPRVYRFSREEAPARYADFTLRALGVMPTTPELLPSRDHHES